MTTQRHRFQHEMILTKVKGQLRLSCRCGVQIGKFKPENGGTTEDAHNEAVGAYQAHIAWAGIVEKQGKRLV